MMSLEGELWSTFTDISEVLLSRVKCNMEVLLWKTQVMEAVLWREHGGLVKCLYPALWL